MHEADEHFRDDRRTHRTEPFAVAALLRLLEDVIPKGRVQMQPVFLGDGAIRFRSRSRRASADS